MQAHVLAEAGARPRRRRRGGDRVGERPRGNNPDPRSVGNGGSAAAGYARRVLTPLSVTGVVVFTACLVLAVLAGLGIFALVRDRGGE